MGIETNPTRVADLNEQWPADGEPALEGAAHLRAIKKAVKGRANVAGQFGITTLNSATDSDSETEAATPKAIKTVLAEASTIAAAADTKAQSALDAVAAFDPEPADNSVLPRHLWEVVAGGSPCLKKGGRVVTNSPWRTELSFYALNSGVFTVKYSVNKSDNYIWRHEGRMLKNGVQVWSGSVENQYGTKSFSFDVSCAVGDLLELQGLWSFHSGGNPPTLNTINVCTGGLPLMANLNMLY